MTDEDILAIAHRTAITYRHRSDPGTTAYGFTEMNILDFARRIEAKVREECAVICDAEATIEGIAQRCAATIRARGEE